MPYRSIPIVKGEIYHVFNRSIAKQPIFLTKRDYLRALETINFYRFTKLPLRFSHFNRLTVEDKEKFINEYFIDNKPVIEIYSYCIMPNHLHFLLRASSDKAISNFMRNFQNSYSKYFNIKNERTGSLFQSMFKAVRIESDEQLLHVSRYIHLNPVTSYIININKLHTYPWSSYKDYFTSDSDSFVNTEMLSKYFKTQEEYKKFIYDHASYLNSIMQIEHLLFE